MNCMSRPYGLSRHFEKAITGEMEASDVPLRVQRQKWSCGSIIVDESAISRHGEQGACNKMG
ncbi:uncharacterized protein BXIN_0191 [Babesia sp. Xinjiang]|uniref:uncharacterized protein n=1 Tax=Babesia sp. Xinjiang TaxID=462227 RepID=UPI000A23624D|nr:uncharacterized protein BXIN_0191 [Babesia sp. Xinjiang]ORM39833.1 hypothetical protein BXIN_0191 [Babesia sp. Xinjiang]